MNVKRIVLTIATLLSLLLIASGCGLTERFMAQAEPTSPPTRTPRPTFTPRPSPTDTPEPTDTPTQTSTAVPTQVPPTATKKPVIIPTRIPPTKTPIPLPTNTPAPTKPPYTFMFAPFTSCGGLDPQGCNIQNQMKCENSGMHWIDVYVFNDAVSSVYLNWKGSSPATGRKVRFSWVPDGPSITPDETAGGDGKAEKTLSGGGDPPTKGVGTYYAWVIDGTGKRISDITPQININANQPNDPNVCWVARAWFTAPH